MGEDEEAITLDDALWDRVVQITGGAASACFQCGVCTAACPWGLVRGESLSVRTIIRRAQLGMERNGADLWLCTTCRQCAALCPRGVDIPGVINSLRQEAWRERAVPKGLASLMWDVHWDGNPWGQPPSQRYAWAKGLDLEPYGPNRDVLFYIGCSATYDRRLQKVARALVSIMQAAGVSFGVLGEGEPCCGEAVQAVGQEGYLNEIVETNTRLFQELGVRTLVTVSPHCYDIFATRYPVGDAFRPLHYTQFLAELAAAGKLPGLKADATVTYHDPCFLGRTHGVYEEPRQVLASISGVDLREMDNNREMALCCGGGGGRMWMETPAEERFAVIRAREALATGAEIIATACPACLSCLEDGLKVVNADNMRVMDVAEIVAMALTPVKEAVASGGGRA